MYKRKKIYLFISNILDINSNGTLYYQKRRSYQRLLGIMPSNTSQSDQDQKDKFDGKKRRKLLYLAFTRRTASEECHKKKLRILRDRGFERSTYTYTSCKPACARTRREDCYIRDIGHTPLPWFVENMNDASVVYNTIAYGNRNQSAINTHNIL